MAETRIPYARSLMLLSERTASDGKLICPLVFNPLNKKLRVFPDWYRCIKNYEAVENVGWGSCSSMLTYTDFTSWRDPFEEEPSAPSPIEEGSWNVNFPDIYYVDKSSGMSSSEFADFVALCVEEFHTTFQIGDVNAIGYESNSYSSRVIPGYLCATRFYSSKDAINNQILAYFGKYINCGGVAVRLKQEYFENANGQLMCSFANNYYFQPVLPETFDDLIECSGICIYDGQTILDIPEDISAPMFFNAKFHYITKNATTGMINDSVETISKIARWTNTTSSGTKIKKGVLSGAGVPYESGASYQVTSSTRELGIRID